MLPQSSPCQRVKLSPFTTLFFIHTHTYVIFTNNFMGLSNNAKCLGGAGMGHVRQCIAFLHLTNSSCSYSFIPLSIYFYFLLPSEEKKANLSTLLRHNMFQTSSQEDYHILPNKYSTINGKDFLYFLIITINSIINYNINIQYFYYYNRNDTTIIYWAHTLCQVLWQILYKHCFC